MKKPFISETFTATGESGREYSLRLWKFRIEERLLSGELSVIETNWKFETADGRHVNLIDGELSLADTGETLTRK